MGYNLFLDDVRMPINAFFYTNEKMFIDWEWIIVRNYDDFVECIEKNGIPNHIAFDHDLGREHYNGTDPKNIDYDNYTEKTGFHCAKWLIEYCMDNDVDVPEYYVHSMNNTGKRNIVSYIENYKRVK